MPGVKKCDFPLEYKYLSHTNTMDQKHTSDDVRILLAWQAKTAPSHFRGPRWYLLAGGFVVACAAYGILRGEWSFTIVMILVAGMYVLTHRSPDTEKSIAILEQGIIFENEFTEWKFIKEFWMLQSPTYIELHVVLRKGRLNEEITIQTGDADPHMIRSVLTKFIPERSGQGERLLDMIIRLCKL